MTSALEAKMNVRAKVYCTEITKTVGGGRIKFFPVCRGEDNKKWASATPSGTIELNIRNEVAVEAFEVGDEYFLDFTPAPKGKEGM